MKKLCALFVMLLVTVGCLTFDTHREGSKVSFDLTLDVGDVNDVISGALDKVIPGTPKEKSEQFAPEITQPDKKVKE